MQVCIGEKKLSSSFINCGGSWQKDRDSCMGKHQCYSFVMIKNKLFEGENTSSPRSHQHYHSFSALAVTGRILTRVRPIRSWISRSVHDQAFSQCLWYPFGAGPALHPFQPGNRLDQDRTLFPASSFLGWPNRSYAPHEEERSG